VKAKGGRVYLIVNVKVKQLLKKIEEKPDNMIVVINVAPARWDFFTISQMVKGEKPEM